MSYDISTNVNSFYKTQIDISFYAHQDITGDVSFVITKLPDYGALRTEGGVDLALSTVYSLNENYIYEHSGNGVLLDDNVRYDVSNGTLTGSGELIFVIQPITVYNGISNNIVYKSSNNRFDVSSNNPSGLYDLSLVIVKDASFGELSISGDGFAYDNSGGINFQDTFTYKYQDTLHTEISSNVATFTVNIVDPILYDISISLNFRDSVTFELSSNDPTGNNYQDISYIFDVSSSFGEVVYDDSNNNATFTHDDEANNINSRTINYYINYKVGSLDVSSAAVLQVDLSGINYPPDTEVIKDIEMATFLGQREIFSLLNTDNNNVDGTNIKYLIINDVSAAVATHSTSKGTVTITDSTNELTYTSSEIGYDSINIVAYRTIDGYSETYEDSSNNNNTVLISLNVTNYDTRRQNKKVYYQSFSSYNTTRLADKRYKLACDLYNNYLYSSGSAYEKADILYNALLAVRGSINAYKYHQPAMKLYQTLVQKANIYSSTHAELSALLSSI